MSCEKKQRDSLPQQETSPDTSKVCKSVDNYFFLLLSTMKKAEIYTNVKKSLDSCYTDSRQNKPHRCRKRHGTAITSASHTHINTQGSVVKSRSGPKVEKQRKEKKLRHSFGLNRFLFQSSDKEPWCPIQKYYRETRKQTEEIKLKETQKRLPRVGRGNEDLERITTGISQL